MDRIHQIREEAERSKDLTLDTSTPPSEAFLTANESSSKFYSLSEEDTTFIVSPTKESSSTSNVDNSITESNLISTLSPIQKNNDLGGFKIGKQIEAANILSGGVNIFDDNSYDGDELVIDDNAIDDAKEHKGDENESNITLDKTDDTLEAADVADAIPSKETEVVLQIDGKNVDAIDIGNGLYLYRKTGEEELAAVQIIDDDQQQPSFKFLKVRENAEGNLEVYEEIEIEVPKEVPTKDGKSTDISQSSIKEGNEVVNEPISDKGMEKTQTSTQQQLLKNEIENRELEKSNKELHESKSELNLNGKSMKFSESRKSPVIGTFTPMTYHSTPNKEGRPLTKIMVDQHLQPNRHSDNIKKTIEVHTESNKQKNSDITTKNKDDNYSKIDLVEYDSKDIVEKISEKIVASSEDNLILGNDRLDKDTVENILKNNKTEDVNTELSKPFVDIIYNDPIKNEKVIISNDDTDTKVEGMSSPKSLVIDSQITVKTLNDGINLNTETKINSSESSFLNVEENISDNADPDIDGKLVIAEDTITTSEDPITTNENSVKLCESNINSGGCNLSPDLDKQSDSGIFIETCENTTEKIEDIKEIIVKDCKTEKINLCNNKTTTIDTVDTDEKVDKQKTINVDFIYKTHNSTPKPETSITSSKKPEEQKIQETVPTNSNMSADNKVLIVESQKDGDVKNSTKSLELKTDIVMSNVSSSDQTIDSEIKSTIKTKEKINSNINSIDEPKSLVKDKTLEVSATKTTNVIPTDLQLYTVKIEEKKDIDKVKCIDNKPICNKVCPAVPFGKWTEANRQEFLNKIKESKVTTNNSNAKQIKQPNDLNRRDVLKKIDSQRQSNNIISAKAQETNSTVKTNIKTNIVAFKNCANNVEHEVISDSPKMTLKEETCLKEDLKTSIKVAPLNKAESQVTMTNKLLAHRKEINNQDLIDKTIEGIINRALPSKATQEDKQNLECNVKELERNSNIITLDDIERKMNELHGIPFVERPPHELPALETKLSDHDSLNSTKEQTVLLHTNKHVVKENEKSNISDEEIIEHEPITGDIPISIKKDKVKTQTLQIGSTIEFHNGAKKEQIITEKDFDKFARRNSVTYENCLTVNFDRREPHNIIQNIVPKEMPIKKLSRNELMLAESKAKSTHKHQNVRHHNHSSKIPTAIKSRNESTNKNYQSKVQLAYHSALTAKRRQGSIPIIEEKPVKVVFLDSDYVPMQLNVHGPELSLSKKHFNESVHSASESVDSDILDTFDELKSQDIKSKSKHQRKQVLTPVETPELELIEPSDLDINSSPKKKRRIEDKKIKTIVPKKSYLLNRNLEDDKEPKSRELNISKTETVNIGESYVVHSDPISAIDNLVKAAELLDTCEKKIFNSEADSNSQTSTPVKRGRGRPRKYPLPGTESDTTRTSSPEKKIVLEIDDRKQHTDSEESIDDEMIKENWTMGKINENIVCPICNKLFRSENVVFKHVKHCTGPSPSRSDSDKRSSLRLRHSEDTKRSSYDSRSEYVESDEEKVKPRKRKSRDTKPAKEKQEESVSIASSETSESTKDIDEHEIKHLAKIKSKMNNLVCELCGKSFRQLSYLLSHKLQHKKEEAKSVDKANKNVFSCEVCKKEFRKLHHLVQHRIIHDPSTMSSRVSRKSSSENHENKNTKQPEIKVAEDHSAGFRCEPCDKSFRKLHHLVEHRETHDGINKKVIPHNSVDATKSSSIHQCDTCKKTFKKLQHLLEHKDQHLETSSDKSDDKSVQSSLSTSTRDIIHECSLCYMVFPNEHSLNKHTIICQRKKKQSAAKQAKKSEEQLLNIKEEPKEHIEFKDDVEKDTEIQSNNKLDTEILEPVPAYELVAQVQNLDKNTELLKGECDAKSEGKESNAIAEDSDSKSDDLPLITKKSEIAPDTNKTENDPKHLNTKTEVIETIIIPDTPAPKKRTAVREKIGITVTKKLRTQSVATPVVEDKKIAESSDDDEIRYMLNPEYQNDTVENKFMKVRAKKRSSLQIERPISKDLIKRRISLQHPPKIPRLKAKPVDTRPVPSIVVKKPKVLENLGGTDSDDSDIKYSFPKAVPEKPIPKTKNSKKRKSLADKRKSLTGVAKRKSLGTPKNIVPVKNVRKRQQVEHRCDCGQLFSSAALLSRHTTLAHTPPRIRKRRSPPPDTKPPKPKPTIKPQPKSTLAQNKHTQLKSTTQKLNVNKNKVATTKPSNSDSKNPSDDNKSEQNVTKRRNAPNRGLQLPEKIRRVNKM